MADVMKILGLTLAECLFVAIQVYLKALTSFRAPKNLIIGITGPESAIRQTTRGDAMPSQFGYLLDSNMEMVRFFGAEYDPQQLAEAIKMEVNTSSR
ncbi:hypothetical protein ZIOFF_040607 [Zingiber officinale]|uniref:Uncharacterized protein n=1 Tax=Zingiber officinale TaxID=94328 RepID=A0A8J5KY46_ZINOF|nr:hypothetical protein ZIOFF_040607 [Zingiber officinale]